MPRPSFWINHFKPFIHSAAFWSKESLKLDTHLQVARSEILKKEGCQGICLWQRWLRCGCDVDRAPVGDGLPLSCILPSPGEPALGLQHAWLWHTSHLIHLDREGVHPFSPSSQPPASCCCCLSVYFRPTGEKKGIKKNRVFIHLQKRQHWSWVLSTSTRNINSTERERKSRSCFGKHGLDGFKQLWLLLMVLCWDIRLNQKSTNWEALLLPRNHQEAVFAHEPWL